MRYAEQWGRRTVKRQCSHCGMCWWANQEHVEAPLKAREDTPMGNGKTVRYFVLHCPECGGAKTKITSTRRPIRYHRCPDCGHTFKSVEQS